MQQKVTLIFDIGKTNKKYFLFDEQLNQLQNDYKKIPEIKDDDGFACDDLAAIEEWMQHVYGEIKNDSRYELVAINFSTYGATLVHLDENGKPCTPLYNYLKELPADIKTLFEEKYGNVEVWSRETASPWLGMLNAGIQLFWLKYRKPGMFKKIRHTLFLPQYFCYLFSKKLVTEFTGIGCHTGMWDYGKHDFHLWMYAEKLTGFLPPLSNTNSKYTIQGTSIQCGAGIHDSSAALVPYFQKIDEPFILLSTGTWSICLNPFNNDPLATEELEEDCLCYLQPDGRQVKASRFFMGNEFSKWVKVLNEHFKVSDDYHKNLEYNDSLYAKAAGIKSPIFTHNIVYKETPRSEEITSSELSWFDTYEEAYHQLIKELLLIQVQKIAFVLSNAIISNIYVDGGFAGNKVFIAMFEQMMPGFTIIPSEMPLGSSLGAAMMVATSKIKVKHNGQINTTSIK